MMSRTIRVAHLRRTIAAKVGVASRATALFDTGNTAALSGIRAMRGAPGPDSRTRVVSKLNRHQSPRPYRPISLLAIAILLFNTPTPAQTAPIERRDPNTTTIHVESRLVNIALNVVDEHGSPVGGLSLDDFELLEDDKPQTIKVFDRESTTPLAIVLAIDSSESVLIDDKLEQAAAKSFVHSILRQQDRIDLMGFSDEVTEVVAFTNDPHRVENGLGRIPHGEATAMYDAIYLASQRLGEAPPAPSQRKVLVLITDGDDTTRHGSYASALEQAERAGAMIYSLIIVPINADAGRNTGGEHALIQLSNDTGGKFYYVEDKRDLAPAFQHVSDDLRTQYTLGYYAPQKGGDRNGLRKIQVQLKDPALRAKYTLRYRTAYYANK